MERVSPLMVISWKISYESYVTRICFCAKYSTYEKVRLYTVRKFWHINFQREKIILNHVKMMPGLSTFPIFITLCFLKTVISSWLQGLPTPLSTANWCRDCALHRLGHQWVDVRLCKLNSNISAFHTIYQSFYSTWPITTLKQNGFNLCHSSKLPWKLRSFHQQADKHGVICQLCLFVLGKLISLFIIERN